jgi:hypothetical protein
MPYAEQTNGQSALPTLTTLSFTKVQMTGAGTIEVEWPRSSAGR